ncbi:MAG: hypothetical protein Ct9H90mP5_10860 [Acidimicrobiaceae bacterium]|nr:MAG: hypothetical protein Ct9H90mP5_10860 [Acidimicrobiaceae bacterium]
MFHLTKRDEDIESRVDWALDIKGLNDALNQCQQIYPMVGGS